VDVPTTTREAWFSALSKATGLRIQGTGLEEHALIRLVVTSKDRRALPGYQLLDVDEYLVSESADPRLVRTISARWEGCPLLPLAPDQLLLDVWMVPRVDRYLRAHGTTDDYRVEAAP
jgi:hypothetical protein